MRVEEGYETLARVLQEALDQSQSGKGKERHADDRPFDDQFILDFSRRLGSQHGVLFQAGKKLVESTRLSPARAKRELLGAIVYTAAAIVLIEEQEAAAPFKEYLTQDDVLRDFSAPRVYETIGGTEGEPMQPVGDVLANVDGECTINGRVVTQAEYDAALEADLADCEPTAFAYSPGNRDDEPFSWRCRGCDTVWQSYDYPIGGCPMCKKPGPDLVRA